MARPKKTGLEYFPLDVVLGDDVELLEAECGLAGFAILVKLWQKIYANGYYIEWEEDNILLFSRKINAELKQVNDVINHCFKRNLFSQEKFFTHRILTSKGIQKRYLQACTSARRKGYSIESAYNLVNTEVTRVNTEETTVNDGVTTEESTQSKVKESKVNESIYINASEEINSEETQEHKTNTFFEKCWSIYPEQIGLSKITDQDKEAIYKLGEEFERTIQRYIESTETKRENGFTQLNYQHGSRFFKGGYTDFLDINYKPVIPKVQSTNKNKFHNYEQGDNNMTNDEMEVYLGTRQLTIDGRNKADIQKMLKGAS